MISDGGERDVLPHMRYFIALVLSLSIFCHDTKSAHSPEQEANTSKL